MTANYLLQKLKIGEDESTVGTVDVGGAST